MSLPSLPDRAHASTSLDPSPPAGASGLRPREPVSAWILTRAKSFQIGPWHVWPDRGELSDGTTSHHLEPKGMEVLVCLALEAGRVVAREELLQAVWPETFIQDSVLFRHVSDLRRILGDDVRNPRYIETIPKRGYRLIAAVSWLDRRRGREPAAVRTSAVEERGEDPRRRRPAWLAALLAITVLGLLAMGRELYLQWDGPPSPTAAGPPSPAERSAGDRSGSAAEWPGDGQPSIAVLPFDGAGLPGPTRHLSVSLAEEVTTALSHAPDLRVRPFSLTSRHAAAGMDPREVGRKVHAESVVTGRLALEGEVLRVTLEGIDVQENTIFWRRTLRVSAADPISLRRQLAGAVGEDLLPALGVAPPASVGVGASDARAYELYLESLAGSRDPEPNREAIAHLTEAVERDPGFAPAWASLAERLYLESAYGSADEPTADQALAAARRAAELDPDLVFPAVLRVVMLAESSRLGKAFDTAWALVSRQPSRAESHLALSYVYRYAGLLEEAARECDIALALSPANYRLRSCALVFHRLGRFDRGQDFLGLEPDSEWALIYGGYAALLKGRPETARLLWRRLPEESVLFGVLDACLDEPASGETLRLLQGHRHPVVRDPEAWYLGALLFQACGRPEAALEMLAAAARLNYCALSALESETVFANLRGLEGWPKVHASLTACRDSFLTHREERLTGHPS